MFARRTPSTALRVARLDAGFYDPLYVENATKVESRAGETITELCPRLLDHSFLSIRSEDYQATGVPFVRVKNLSGLILDEDFVYISEKANQRESQTICTPGDLLFAKTGKIATCPVPPNLSQVNTSQDVMVGTVRHGVDPYYVAAYLNCRHGLLYQERYVQGPVQPHLSLGSLRQIYVVTPCTEAQRYVGDKVRQAERLRERARSLEAESAAFFLLPEWTEPRAGTLHSYTARGSVMRSERLDAAFYDPGHEALDDVLRRRGDIELSEVASFVGTRWKRSGDRFHYFEIGDLDISSGLLTPALTDAAAAPSRAQVLVEPWDVLVSTVRPNRKNIGLVLPFDESLALVASTGFAVLRFNSPETAAFYHSFLRSDVATQQLMRWNSGATYPAIESDVPLRVRAPRFDNDVVVHKGRRWLTKFSALQASGGLIQVAMTLVENLIDGRIPESDLVAAQKALDTGDRSADRAILSALRQSDAPDAKPLIPDVDALYALLDAPEQDPE